MIIIYIIYLFFIFYFFIVPVRFNPIRPFLFQLQDKLSIFYMIEKPWKSINEDFIIPSERGIIERFRFPEYRVVYISSITFFVK
jgi:hypothetical protein